MNRTDVAGTPALAATWARSPWPLADIIRAKRGRTVSVVLPGERLDDAERQRTSTALLSTVRQISQQIGAPGVEVATA